MIRSVGLLTVFISSISYALPPAQSAESMGYSRPRSEAVTSEYNGNESLPLINAVADQEAMQRAFLQKISDDRSKTLFQETPDINGINVDQAILDKYAKDFDNIIVVNKAPTTQRLAIFRFGQLIPNEAHEVKDKKGNVTVQERWKISTGTERWSCEVEKDDSGNIIGAGAVWTGTPTGFYPSFKPDIDHHSRAFDDAWMEYAFFFNGGIATHKGMEPWKFGIKRASHGCVRMTEKDAKEIFKLTLLSGGPVDFNYVGFQGQCPHADVKTGAELDQCRAHAASESKRYHKDLVEMLAFGANERGADNSALPYSDVQTVPDLKRDGNPNLDHNTGEVKKKAGYRTLVIVQCVERDGSDCSVPPLKRDQFGNLTGGRPPKPDCPFEGQVAQKDNGFFSGGRNFLDIDLDPFGLFKKREAKKPEANRRR